MSSTDNITRDSTGRVDGEKDTFEDVGLSDRSAGLNGGITESMDGQDGTNVIVPPEGKQTGLLARVKKPRPLPSKRRLGAMM